MFDNGSEVTLVTNHFAEKDRHLFKKAPFTLSAIGSKPATYNKEKIYSVPLVDSNGEVILVKAFSVDSSLVEKVGREEIVLKKKDFPHFSKAVLKEAVKPLPNKYVDVLIGNPTFLFNMSVELDSAIKIVL